VIDIAAEVGMQTPLGRQLLPTIEGHDGFYYALLCKK
jgi:16S rRNA (cytosine967-C5)-methyltransferase